MLFICLHVWCIYVGLFNDFLRTIWLCCLFLLIAVAPPTLPSPKCLPFANQEDLPGPDLSTDTFSNQGSSLLTGMMQLFYKAKIFVVFLCIV